MTEGEVRAKAWKTRREKYGPRGHSCAYLRAKCGACHTMRDLIIRLHNEGVLSEGQAARATGLSRVDIRILADADTRAA